MYFEQLKPGMAIRIRDPPFFHEFLGIQNPEFLVRIPDSFARIRDISGQIHKLLLQILPTHF